MTCLPGQVMAIRLGSFCLPVNFRKAWSLTGLRALIYFILSPQKIQADFLVSYCLESGPVSTVLERRSTYIRQNIQCICQLLENSVECRISYVSTSKIVSNSEIEPNSAIFVQYQCQFGLSLIDIPSNFMYRPISTH